MSMSQEEIESLMSGLDIADEDKTEETKVEEEPEAPVNTDEIEELISQAETVAPVENETVDTIENIDTSSSSDIVNTEDIDDLLKDIEASNDIVEPETTVEKKDVDEDDCKTKVVEKKIEEGIFPLPAEKDTKVVSQLNEVANDSEEKVGQIFDILSLALDNNGTIRNNMKDFENFAVSQAKILESLNKKFPNIEAFKSSLSELNTVNENLKSLTNTLNEEDNQIFAAMELMQFNDINRQKIERVMAVIRKLSLYLNNLFEDDGDREIVVAKHIHGDHSDDLIGEDLDKLINEFGNN